MDIIQLFFEENNKEFHVREVARKAGVSATTASKKLEELRREGLLLKEEKYRHHLYKASNNEIFTLEKQAYLLRKNKKNASKIIKEASAEAIILTRRGLVAIGGKGSVRGAKTFSIKEIDAMKQTDPNFLNELVNGTVIVGEWRLFK